MNMQGKICLVTGATDGIGFVTARELARQGADVIIHGRSPEKGRKALEAIRRDTGTTPRFVQADFSALGEVRQLAAQLNDSLPRLDVLVHNAGRGPTASHELSQDGYELVFAVNHLAPFLLTNLLLDKLKAAGRARVVTVSSVGHTFKPLFDMDDLMSEKVKPIHSYGRSKFANILFSNELARRLADTGVTANALHPGTIRSNFGHEATVTRIFYKLAGPFLKTPEQGARTLIHLATAPELEDATGGYYVDSRPAATHPKVHEPGLGERFWTVSEQLVGL